MKLLDRAITKRNAKIIIITPFVLLFLMAIITLYPGTRDFGVWLLAENHPVELGTFLFLLIGSFLGLKFTFDIKNSQKLYVVLFYGIFSVFLFLVAMEEIAWGQQYINFETPSEWKKINIQGETTLHNIEGLQGKSELFRLVFGLGGLLGILLKNIPVFSNISPSKLLLTWFAIIAVHASIDLYTDYIEINEFYDRGIQRTSELIELFIAISAFLYLWLNKRKMVNA